MATSTSPISGTAILDPAGLILDMLLRIEEAARIAAPA